MAMAEGCQHMQKIYISKDTEPRMVKREGIAFISYFFSTDSFEDRPFVYSDKAIITVPTKAKGTQVDLYVEPVATNDDGSANTITKTGWQKYTLVYPKLPAGKKSRTPTRAIPAKNFTEALIKSFIYFPLTSIFSKAFRILYDKGKILRLSIASQVPNALK